MHRRYNAEEAAKIIAECESDSESISSNDDPVHPIVHTSDSDSSQSDSDDSNDDSTTGGDTRDETIIARDGTTWYKEVPRPAQYRQRNIINAPKGPTHNLRGLNVEAVFKYFIDETTVRLIVDYTNTRIASENVEHRQDREVTIDEIYAYIGILVLLGVLKKRNVEISDIWCENSGAFHRVDFVCATMSRERFQFLSRFITFDDIATREERLQTDRKLFKFREIFNRVRTKCLTAYDVGPHVSVDEHLYPFRGHFMARQYMPKKPAKYGMKIWQLVDSESRYLLNFNIYLGKEGDQITKGLGEKVVLELSSPINRTGRNITCDNFFTSKALALKLWENGLTLVGTIRANRRELPSAALPNKTREVHSTEFFFSEFVTLVSYVPKERKAINLLSTQHHDKQVELDEQKKKPHVISYYNSTMGGCDTFDQLVVNYSCRRATRRWTMRLFHYIIDSMMINTLVIVRELLGPEEMVRQYHNPRSERRKFMEKLAFSLMEPHIKTRSQTYTSLRGVSIRLQESFKAAGYPLVIQAAQPIRRQGGALRCYICPRTSDRKCRTSCQNCNRYVCGEHSEKVIRCNPQCQL